MSEFTIEKWNEYVEFHELIEDKVFRAATLYNSLLKEGDIPLCDDVKWHTFDTQIAYQDGVTVNWSTSWQYGGYAEGSHDIPLDCLLDTTWEQAVREKASAIIEEQASKKIRTEEFVRATKEAQFAKLKKELEK